MAVETKKTRLGSGEGRGEAPERSVRKPYGGRCSGCGTVYVGTSMMLLYSDETGHYCRCGGRLREEVVELAVGRRYRLVVPEELRAVRTDLRRRIERSSGDGARVEVVKGNRRERVVTLIVGENRVTGLLENRRFGEPNCGRVGFVRRTRTKRKRAKR